MRCFATGLIALLLSHNALAAVIMQYHHVSNTTPKSTSISPELFVEHMNIIEESGFEVIALSELVKALKENQPIPNDAVVITFDDGYSDNFAPIMEHIVSRGWPYTVFVTPEAVRVNQYGYMGKAELQKLVDSGGELANHTWSHIHLPKKLAGETEANWEERVLKQIERTEDYLKKEFSQNFKMLAYPYGEFSSDLQGLLSDRGYVGIGQHSGAVGKHSDLMALPRFPMGGFYGEVADFKMKLRALPMPVVKAALDKDGSHIRSHKNSWPTLTVQLTESRFPRVWQVTCFATGQGRIEVEKLNDHKFSTVAGGNMPIGRSRYNCTAPSMEKGRYYWMSQPFIRLDEGDEWPPEP